MFTGLVDCMGTVISVSFRNNETRLEVRPGTRWDSPEQGESIACNGVCLTVERWNKPENAFSAYASAETCSCTNIGLLRPGSPINLERALQLGGRLGGHIVSGHADAMARVESSVPAGESHRVRLSCEARWSAFIVPKGSVTLDGISLTVNACGDGWFEVNIIPETWNATTACLWKAGSPVNLETDVLAKYVSHLLKPYGGGADGHDPGISMDLLARNGFLGM